jgi:2-polyprenyl-3-methyl-5-hydroxy-6-metoxy-1,4-benzoquinol methylase
MAWVVDVRRRRRQPEIMDQPGLDPGQHAGALRCLQRVNWLSRPAAIFWPHLRDLARENPAKPLEILDVATGAGDIPIKLWLKARRAALNCRIDACDVSSVALEHARKNSGHAEADVHFFTHDVLAGPLPREYDTVICSLFLHHLETDDAVEVLRRMAASARRLVLVNDLQRSKTGWLIAWAGTRVLTTSHVARFDGPVSVEGAFTPTEARELAERAGMIGAAVRRCWPWRWLLTWRRPEGRGT